MSAVVGAAVTPELTSLPAFPALFLILSLLVLVYDLHLQTADVERYSAEPEEGDTGHRGALEQQRRHRQQHHPPQGEEAAEVRGSTERHAHASQDEEGWAQDRSTRCVTVQLVIICASGTDSNWVKDPDIYKQQSL